MMTPARINEKLIKQIIESFPNGHDWEIFKCRDVPIESTNGRWKLLDKLKDNGGVYAILLPIKKFRRRHIIHLHGPNRTKIPFEFTFGKRFLGDYWVVYVGRTSNLMRRFHSHLSYGNRIASAQVKYGLLDCGIFRKQKKALAYLLKEGQILYRLLPGPMNCANRDLIELTLCACLHPPFNIKSER